MHGRIAPLTFFALVAAMAVLGACSSNDDNGGDEGGDETRALFDPARADAVAHSMMLEPADLPGSGWEVTQRDEFDEDDDESFDMLFETLPECEGPGGGGGGGGGGNGGGGNGGGGSTSPPFPNFPPPNPNGNWKCGDLISWAAELGWELLVSRTPGQFELKSPDGRWRIIVRNDGSPLGPRFGLRDTTLVNSNNPGSGWVDPVSGKVGKEFQHLKLDPDGCP